MTCTHEVVIPNELRGIKPGHWSVSGGKYHFDGLCDGCREDVWRHANNAETEIVVAPWQLKFVPCGC
jgi:hypothetical protein